RALAASSAVRLPTLPEVPPFGEAAGAPDFEAVSWHILLAPAATPQEIVDRLHQEMRRIMSTPQMKKRASDIGLLPRRSPPPARRRGRESAATSSPSRRSGDPWSGSSASTDRSSAPGASEAVLTRRSKPPASGRRRR